MKTKLHTDANQSYVLIAMPQKCRAHSPYSSFVFVMLGSLLMQSYVVYHAVTKRDIGLAYGIGPRLNLLVLSENSRVLGPVTHGVLRHDFPRSQ